MKRALKIGGITIGSILLLMILIMIIGPIIARSYVQNNSKELLGRIILIDDIDLNLFTTTISVDGLTIKENNDTADFVRLGNLTVNTSLFKLISSTVDVSQLHINDLELFISQDSTNFNFDDIVAHFNNGDTLEVKEIVDEVADATEDVQKSSWIVSLHDIQLNNSRIQYTDNIIGSKFDLNDINIAIPDLYLGDQESAGGIDLDFEGGGHLSTNLKFDLESSDFDFAILLENFKLNSTLPYLKPVVRASDLQGNLTSDIHLTGNLNHIIKTSVAGTVDITDFSLSDSIMNQVVSIDRSLVDIAHVNLDSLYIHLNKVLLRGAHTNAVMERDSSINLLNMMVLLGKDFDADLDSAQRAELIAADTLPKRPPHFVVDEIDFDSLSLTFTDETLLRPFCYNITNGSIKGKKFTTEKNNELRVKANIGATGNLICAIQLNIPKLPDVNLSIKLTNIDLTEFSPYTSQITGFNITKGNLSLQNQDIIKNEHIESLNSIDIYKCEVEKDESVEKPEMKVPLKLALCVLKDKKDHISLEIPVSGDLYDPNYSYSKIIMGTLKNLLVKVATTPFSAIGSLFKSKKDDLSRIDFDGSEQALNNQQYERLNAIADLLMQKSELKLMLTQNINYTENIKLQAINDLKKACYFAQHEDKDINEPDMFDRKAIKEMSDKDERLVAYAKLMSTKSEKVYDVAIERYANDAKQQIIDKANRRAETIKKYLIERKGLQPERFSIITPAYDPTFEYKGDDYFAVHAIVGEEDVEFIQETEEELANDSIIEYEKMQNEYLSNANQ